jgi:type VI secretion system protein ImpL
MLVKNRPRRPINGLLVAVSVGDLMGTEEEAVALGGRIRDRVNEVMSRLKMNVPVYVLFTKADLLAGFVETFADLTKGDRGQVWGFTHAVDESRGDARALFGSRFDELLGQLEARSLWRLTQERRAEARGRIYQFPQQFAALRQNLSEFVGTLFAETGVEENPFLRGCYFTSGTQEGSPIDRVMNAMAEAFGIRQALRRPLEPAQEGKSYFLRELFSGVIFPDEKLAVRSAKELKRQQTLRLAYAGAALAVAVALFFLPLIAFFKNRSLIGDVRDHAADVAKDMAAGAPASAVFMRLDPLRADLDNLVTWEKDGAPWSLRLGMYQGSRLLPAARDVYATILQRTLVKPLLQADSAALRAFVEQQEVSNPSRAEFAQAFDLLKLHLVLTGPRAAGEPSPDAPLQAFIAGQLRARAAQRLGSSPELTRVNAAHAQLYARLLGESPPPLLSRDEGLVRRARASLKSLSPAALALERLVAEVAREEEDFTLSNLLGGVTSKLRSTGHVRAAFTRRGWEERVRPRLEAGLSAADAWVPGPTAARRDEGADASALALRNEYFQQYIQEWRGFLESISVAAPASSAEALALLEELTRGKPPPLGRLFQGVAYQVRLEEGGAAGAVEEVGEKFAQTVRKKLGAQATRAASVEAALRSPDNLLEPRDVADAFSGFTRFGTPPPKPPEGAGGGGGTPGAPLDAYQEQLEFLRDALRGDLENPEDHGPLLTRLQTARVAVKSLIDSQETGWRPRLEALLWPPIEALSQSSTRDLAAGTSAKWCSTVVASFDKRLASRYPFSRHGHDAAIADVGEFYRPDAGTVDAFYLQVLKNDVLRSGDNYEFAHRLGNVAATIYRPQLLQFLKRSHDITETLFPPNEKDPLTEFSVHIRPSPKVASITFTVDGQRVSYQNGPEEWHTFQWPGKGKVLGASLWVRSNKGVSETVEQEGEWGLFRLLEAGVLQAAPGQRTFSVTWRIQSLDTEVTLDVRPSRAESPFLGPHGGKHLQLLEPFRAPGVVPPRGVGKSGGCAG